MTDAIVVVGPRLATSTPVAASALWVSDKQWPLAWTPDKSDGRWFPAPGWRAPARRLRCIR